MIIIKDAVLSFIEKIKNAQKIHKVTAIVLAAAIVVSVSVAASGLRLTYNVKFDGKVVANVSTLSVYEMAMKKACEMIGSDKGEIADATVQPTISFGSKSLAAEQVSEIILDNAPDVCHGFTLSVDGKEVANLKDDDVALLAADNRLSSFNVEGAECENSFAKSFSIKPAYFHVSALSTDESAVDIINTLDVVTVATTTKVFSVSYDTETQSDSSKNAGYEKIVTEGVNGENQTVEKITYLNGVPSAEPEVTEVVLKYPINEVIVVGTKNVFVSSTPQSAASAGFVHPLAGRGVVTSPYGDSSGRNHVHGGIDIGVDVRTPIVAAKGGKVIEVGNNRGYSYGLYVVIDHGDGLVTRYAHNDLNLVSVGQVVSTGDLIAYSGNTGRSTGPHLHFEIMKNGICINPAYYIKF